MSWRIAVDAREIFVELAATDGAETHLVRTLNRKDQLWTGVAESIALLPEAIQEAVRQGECKIWMVSDLERVALREHWGSHAAFVMTEGFENLLDVGLQQRENTFGLNLTKTQTLISKDYSFGISERTLSDGRIQKPLDQTEIDTILSKLELSDVKTVGVCFLHSRKNPQHEKEVGAKLKEKGFTVFLSHEESGNELERASKVATKAFLAGGRKDLQEKLLAMGFKEENIFLKTERPLFSQPLTKEGVFIEFLEDRVVTHSAAFNGTLHTSLLGVIDIDFGGLIHIGPHTIDSEPGPVAFGKGLKPTAFDLLALNGKLSAPEIPKLKIENTKILRQLAPLAQTLRLDSETLAEKGLQLFLETLALEIEKTHRGSLSFVAASGWLAPAIAPTIARRLGTKKLFIPTDSGWAAPLQLLETAPKKGKAKVIGKLEVSVPGHLEEGELHDL